MRNLKSRFKNFEKRGILKIFKLVFGLSFLILMFITIPLLNSEIVWSGHSSGKIMIPDNVLIGNRYQIIVSRASLTQDTVEGSVILTHLDTNTKYSISYSFSLWTSEPQYISKTFTMLSGEYLISFPRTYSDPADLYSEIIASCSIYEKGLIPADSDWMFYTLSIIISGVIIINAIYPKDGLFSVISKLKRKKPRCQKCGALLLPEYERCLICEEKVQDKEKLIENFN